MNDNGRIDINLDPAMVAEVLGLIEQIVAKLPFLVRLDNAEKQHLAKPRAGSNEVADKLLALQDEAGLPVAPDDPMVADLSVSRGLTKIGHALSELITRIDDTTLLAASEAWSECLIRYGTLRQIARSKPQLTERLDAVQPLISRRRARKSPAPAPSTEQPAPTAEQLSKPAS